MICSLFLFSPTGEVLIEKHWRGVTSRSICDVFWDEVTKSESKDDVPPVISTSKYHLINIYRSNIYLLATSVRETPPLLIIEFLHRVYEIFEDYFGTVEETTIKENFSTVYQLLEEMMDNGYPLLTEPNGLKAMISPPSMLSRLTSAAIGSSSVSDVLPYGTISNMPWRKTDVKYTQNEIYLDIIEEIDVIIDRNGTIISSHVNGLVVANCKLSGIPDLLLTFTDPGVIDECSFHPCVRYNRFEKDRVISFVPPDGLFELMRFGVKANGGIAAPCYCQPQIGFDRDQKKGTISIAVGVKTQNSLILTGNASKTKLTVEDVVVLIPFSRGVRTANFSVTAGTVLFDESTKIAKWSVGKLTIGSNYPQLTGTIIHHTNDANHVTEEAPPIKMEWKVPMSSVSGLSVGSLNIVNEKYKPYKGVRNIVKSGDFQIRTF